jgi:hypothetical protein
MMHDVQLLKLHILEHADLIFHSASRTYLSHELDLRSLPRDPAAGQIWDRGTHCFHISYRTCAKPSSDQRSTIPIHLHRYSN